MSGPAGLNLAQVPKPGFCPYLGQYLCQGPGPGLNLLRPMWGIVEQKFFSNSNLVPSPDSGPLANVPSSQSEKYFPISQTRLLVIPGTISVPEPWGPAHSTQDSVGNLYKCPDLAFGLCSGLWNWKSVLTLAHLLLLLNSPDQGIRLENPASGGVWANQFTC